MVYKNAEDKHGEGECISRSLKWVPVFRVAQTDGEYLSSVHNRLGGG